MTLTDIANVALEEIGAKSIGNIDGDESNARKVKRRLPLTIADVASKHNWSCLVRDVKLYRIDEPQPEGGLYKFNRPKWMFKIIEPRFGVSVEGDYILSSTEELTVKCTICDEDSAKWDSCFLLSVIAQLKADICFMVVGDAQLALNLKQLAEIDIRRYMRQDSFAKKNRKPPTPLLPDGFVL